ncbi:MAG: radical SAM protein [Deltaproteobacteria bacterium]|jgi:nitrogenase molybdenum-iron protein alpha/beta subunit/MoaA/NifB/PqqE/SkfB family radical SAM enzyme|nr:radical SAM protein [Deltaproteobacteria bacterium]
MREKLAHINANPCKMCFPLGVVTAFYGIREGLTLLHGSQGCGTYIRRHLATHYQEPVDIASSSLTEEGAVFGGEANLKKGLDNLIRLYQPRVIGVGTTCLAETIGEDVPAILRNYASERPDLAVKLIPVASAGYSGTHYEGWFKGARAIVEALAVKTAPHSGINVFVPPSSPADLRALKKLLDESGLDYVLFPDISHNLDRPYDPVYKRLPEGGTPLEAVASLAGARVSLELSRFCPKSLSPGVYLEETFGVPLIRLGAPIGLRDNDIFLKTLQSLGGRVSPATLAERGRYLDAMLDAHKHSALGRAGIFGDPDLVSGLVRLAVENGLRPVLAGTGSVALGWAEAILAESAGADWVARGEKILARTEVDFSDIERWSVESRVNLLLGSSEGRRLAEKRAWPLVRCAFPVHDRQGGSRLRLYGFDGSLALLDNIVNAIRAREESSFRARLKEAYFQPQTEGAALESPGAEAATELPAALPPPDLGPEILRPAWGLLSSRAPTETHPCFSQEAAHTYARLHLPVAPKCDISCNYCRRDFDCPNESRPGVTSAVLSPQAALERFRLVRAQLPNLKVVGVAGPGEALANFSELAETMELIRREDPEIFFCLSTNGLNLPLRARELRELGARYLTITINSLDPRVGARIYKEINFLGRSYQGVEGAAMLQANQLVGLKMAVDLGLKVKINTVILSGLNEGQAVEIHKMAAQVGATIGNVMQHIPVEGSPLAHLPQISRAGLSRLSWECQAHLPQMRHCRQCRADAVGLLSEDLSYQYRPADQLTPPVEPAAWVLSEDRANLVRVAVLSKSGVVVDQHFGQAERLLIYDSDGQSLRLRENRQVDLGSGGCRGGFCGQKDPLADQKPEGFIARLVAAAADCDAVVATRVGQSPRDKLAARGVRVVVSFDTIDRAALAAAQEVLSQRELVAEGRLGS